ncbi:MucBP domain-containing protein [Enterococcus ureasiticus]|uniref:MucBP domain-containing protein n=1 Tax=Enterococcus ureasiticus TaxID=903984 RepID=UPI001F5FB997|nr:MucBP domain-containing protein [Enterococcus ureasiticus]
MMKKNILLVISLLALTQILPIETLANNDIQSSDSNEILEKTTKTLEDMQLKNILPGNLDYSANSTEFSTGDQYRGTLHLVNTDGNTISASTKIIVAIPAAAVDYSTWDFTDPTLSNLFDVVISADQGIITFILKSDIIGVADISVPFSTIIIGPENTSYPVSVSAQNTDGSFTDVVVNNNQIIIPKADIPNPSYGILNMYWGVKDSNLSNTFLGKNPIAIDNISTGVFSRTTNNIQNFIEINPEQKNILSNDEHYEVNYEIHSTRNVGDIYLDEIEVVDATANKIVPESEYESLFISDSSIYIIINSPEQSGTHEDGSKIIQTNHKYIVNLTSLATNDGDVYNSNSSLQIKNDSSVINEESFGLNNIFTTQGFSVIFPNITADNKIYEVGELTVANISGKVTAGIFATDTIDGNLTDNIKTDYKDLLSKKDTIGVYPEQVSYSVTNSLGYTSIKNIIVTITDKQRGKDVTIKYVDTDENTISDDIVKSGNVGEDYTTEQKNIDGYTFKEVQGNATGQFTDQAQTVIYVYTKNKVESEKPNNHSNHKVDPVNSEKPDNNSNHKEKRNNDKDLLYLNQQKLPKTGENERISLVGIFLGIILLFSTLGTSIHRFIKLEK